MHHTFFATRAFFRLPALAGLLAAAALAAANPVAAQVKYYDRPPTPEEIAAALAGPKTQAPAAQTGAQEDTGAKAGAVQIHSRGLVKRRPSDVPVGEQINSAAGAAPASSASASPAPSGQGPAIALPVVFDVGSSHIASNSMPFIQAMVSVLERDPSLRLVVEGHTDAIGSARANMMLSWDRAYSVFRVMVERFGIDPARLQPMGKGSTEPLSDHNPMDGANRRVQFRVMG